MGMSDAYGPADRDESLATISAALERGVTLLAPGDFYGMGPNEMLLGEALRGRARDEYVLSVKFGAQRSPDGAWIGYDARPAAVKSALSYSLKRLQTDYVDIYRPARLDPNVPVEETIGAIAELVERGYVRHIGLSEVGAETIRRAHAVHRIADLQIEYAIVTRGVEERILPVTRELGIGITAYGVLSRGLIGGHWGKDRVVAANDFRKFAPRFSAENIERNLELAERVASVAREHHVTAAQLAIAWVLARGSDIVPVVGARTVARLAEALGALDLALSASEAAAIGASFPPDAILGQRYAPQQMATLDSERATDASVRRTS